MKKTALLIISILLVSGCQLTNNKTEVKEIKNTPVSLSNHENIEFNLIKINNKDVNFEFETPSLKFTNTKELGSVISGNTGCNNYMGQYSTTRSILIIPQMGVTMKMCSPEENRTELFITQILNSKPQISFSNKDIILKSNDQELTFAPKKENVKKNN